MNLKNKMFASYLIAILTLLFMSFYSSKFFEEEIAYCGVKDFGEGLVNEVEIKEGKKLFKSLCAACHKLDKNLVGPALGNLEMDSVRLHEYLISKKHSPAFFQLTLENSNDILNYINTKELR